MRNLTIATLSFLIVFYSSCVGAEALKTITLKDGTVIKGTITEFKDQTYSIQTNNLGLIRVKDSDIVGINLEGSAPGAQQNTPLNAQSNPLSQADFKNQVQQVQGTVLSDPKIMSDIQNLLNDEKIRNILSDPKFINEVMSYDPEKIKNNDKVHQLMDTPEMQKLMQKIENKISTDKE